MFGPFNNLVERNTAREIEAWKESCGGNFRLFAPTAATAKIATLPHHLFDKDRAIHAYARGRHEALGI
jgi:hypothetical protein